MLDIKMIGLIYSNSKEELKKVLIKIENYLKKEKMILNPKTRIYSNKDKYVFLGRTKEGKYSKRRQIKRKIKERKYLYYTNKIELKSFIASSIYYEYLEGNKL